jgi:hypothetical protein
VTQRGIPTLHAGTRFRSRLEARWATFFDAIGWRWEYEPYDLRGYIPDFLIFGAEPFLIEVKPYSTANECLFEQCRLPAVEGYAQLVVGIAPLLEEWIEGNEFYDAWWAAGNLWSANQDDRDLWRGTAVWGVCQRCGKLAVERLGFCSQPRVPCGHRESPLDLSRSQHLIEALWANARNQTQWASRR